MAVKRIKRSTARTLLTIPASKKRILQQNHSFTALQNIATRLRIHSVRSTSVSGSGHPTTCSSLAQIFAVLFFDPSGLKYFPQDPKNFNNDKLVLSKGHAAPILYAAWAQAGLFPVQDLLNLRKIDSDLQGHPTPRLPFVDVATGSLGQGISAACGMAYAMKYYEGQNGRVYSILGDGECAEGSVWEAFQFASHYELDNLVAIIDINRLGQSEATRFQHDLKTYKDKLTAFGWNAINVDGHSLMQLVYALDQARKTKNTPTAILAKTFKGRGLGVDIEDKLNWHGKPLGDKTEQVLENLNSLLEETKQETQADTPISNQNPPEIRKITLPEPSYSRETPKATRNAYGEALTVAGNWDDRILSLDGDTKNSTMSCLFKQEFESRFIECHIAEQNMIGTALGLSCRGLIPFVSAFSAFLTRGCDHIRMCGLSWGNVKFVGSHSGVSIGQDGGSQMGLEDLAIFRAIPGCVVLYPSDAVSTYKSVQLVANFQGPCYLRISRPVFPIVYQNQKVFQIGKSYIVKEHENDQITIIGGGVTLHESLKAAEILQSESIFVKVVDIFSLKPLDSELLKECGRKTRKILTVEDHYQSGGIFEAVSGCLASENIQIFGQFIEEVPRSGKSEELLEMYGISAGKIMTRVKSILSN